MKISVTKNADEGTVDMNYEIPARRLNAVHITHTYKHPGYGFDDIIKKFMIVQGGTFRTC